MMKNDITFDLSLVSNIRHCVISTIL